MKRILLAALVGVLVGLTPPAYGQSFKDGTFAGIQHVYVNLNDTVKGGCLPNPDAIKNAIELKFLENGIKVLEKDKAIFQPILSVNLLGFAVTNKSGVLTGCAVYILMKLSSIGAVSVPFSTKDGKSAKDISYIEVWESSYLLVGPKEDMQSRIKSQVEDYADAVILKILKTQQEVFAKYPHMKKNFERLSK